MGPKWSSGEESWKWFHLLLFLVENVYICLQFLYSCLCSLPTVFTIMLKIWCMTIILYTSLCCPHDAGFCLWENAVRELQYNYSQNRSLLTGMEENPALVLYFQTYTTQQNNSQRLSDFRLYRPLHVHTYITSLRISSSHTYCVPLFHHGQQLLNATQRNFPL